MTLPFSCAKTKAFPALPITLTKHCNTKSYPMKAFRLDASLAICMMIDALRYLSDPENRIARASLITNYQLQIKGYAGSLDNLLTAPAETLLPEAFIKKIGILRLMPLYELLEELFSLFEMNRISDQDAYLFRILRCSDGLSAKQLIRTGRLYPLLGRDAMQAKPSPVERWKVSASSPSTNQKGLEFHTVLLPFCDWKLENETNNQLVWCIPEEAPFNELDIVPVNYSAQMGASLSIRKTISRNACSYG